MPEKTRLHNFARSGPSPHLRWRRRKPTTLMERTLRVSPTITSVFHAVVEFSKTTGKIVLDRNGQVR